MPSQGQDVRLRMIVPPERPPWVPSATLLLNLQADALVLNDNDPVSIWTDLSGNGHDFSPVDNSHKPTFLLNYLGFPAVYFPSVAPDYFNYVMDGGNFADGLSSFSVFSVSMATNNNGISILTKASNRGWDIWTGGNGASPLVVLLDTGKFYQALNPDQTDFSVNTYEILSFSDVHCYVDENNSNEQITQSGSVSNISNTESVLLGASGFDGWIRSVMLYAPAPNVADRSAIEHWLAAKYGITLP